MFGVIGGALGTAGSFLKMLRGSRQPLRPPAWAHQLGRPAVEERFAEVIALKAPAPSRKVTVVEFDRLERCKLGQYR